MKHPPAHRSPAPGRWPAVLATLFALLWGSHPAGAAEGPRLAAVDELYASFEEGVRPGAAVLVIRAGQVVHRAGYGYADLAGGRRITPSSQFRLASVSKQFTAMAIALLAGRGELTLADPAGRYVPTLERYPGVTLRHLLAHTSGLPDYYEEADTFPWVARGDLPSNADAMAFLAEAGEPLFPPGQRYEYSNPAYEVLPLVVESVTGTPFARFMHEQLFAPLGMAASLVHDHRRPRIAERVLGYRAEAGVWALNDYDPLNGVTGSGGQYSSLEDFVAWDRALQGERLLGAADLGEVFTRARLAGGETIDYGLGWRLDAYRGHPRQAHGGSWVGFRTAIARYPEAALTLVVLANFAGFDTDRAIDELSELLLDAPAAPRGQPPAADPESGS